LKVLVVGAGPAGLACARSILTHNPSIEVTVVDKKSKVGENPRCAGGISLYMMGKVGVSVPEACIVAKVRRVRIYAPNMDYWELKGEDYGYVLNRELFEQATAEKVEGLGDKMILNQFFTFKDLDREFFAKSQYDYIVGADGPASVVRQWLGLPRLSLEDVHIGVQKTISMDYYPQDTIQLYFGENVAPQGYAWIFPCGDGKVRIGLGIPSSKGPLAMSLLDQFISRQVNDYKVIDCIGKQIPTTRMPKTGVYGNILLVGDALPSTDPVTGGGIMQAIASGKAAGQALAEARPENYDGYVGWLRKQNNRRYRLKKVLNSFSDEDFNDLIHVMQGFRPKTMSIGKELRSAVIHLLLRKPRLLRKFFKSLH
jgi:digeranylgeranylglycerophospholipid reductase